MTRGCFWLLMGLLPLSPAVPGRSFASTLGQGRISFDKAAVDFGEVNRGDKLKYSFSFTNAGDGPLVIQAVHAPCGCTAVDVEKAKTYAPGEKGSVDVTLDSTNFAGPVVKVVTVMTNESILPDRILTLKASVHPQFLADPPLADFGDVAPGSPEKTTIRIRPASGFDLQVKGLRFNNKALDVSSKPDGKDWQITIGLKPNQAAGFFKDTVFVSTNSTALPELPIPVRAEIKSHIQFTPDYLEFGAIDPSDSSRRRIELHGADPFAVTGSRVVLDINGQKVGDVKPFVKISANSTSDKSPTVSVQLVNPGTSPGSAHGKIYLHTSHPETPEVTLDFYAFFR